MFLTDLNTNLNTFVEKLETLMDSFWKYAIIALIAIIVVWGIYIGVKIIVANRNEEKVNAKGMLKNLLIGVVIIFVIAIGAPLLIEGLAAWADKPTTGLSLITNFLKF